MNMVYSDSVIFDSIALDCSFGECTIWCYAFPKHFVFDKSDGTMCDEYKEFRENGSIYVLAGHSPYFKNSLDDEYVGQTERDWRERLYEPHGKEKTRMRRWWNHHWEYTFVFTPAYYKWNGDCLNYLEYWFCRKASDAKLCNIVNTDTPDIGNKRFGKKYTKEDLDNFIVEAGYWLQRQGFSLF